MSCKNINHVEYSKNVVDGNNNLIKKSYQIQFKIKILLIQKHFYLIKI